jgi:hypothetical protein
MTDFGLTQEQLNKLLLSDGLGPYIADYLRLGDLDLFYENPQLIYKYLSERQKIDTALYAFAQGARTVEKIDDPSSSDYQIQIAECEGVYGVWSDRTDWIIPFNSHQVARDFVDRNLIN